MTHDPPSVLNPCPIHIVACSLDIDSHLNTSSTNSTNDVLHLSRNRPSQPRRPPLYARLPRTMHPPMARLRCHMPPLSTTGRPRLIRRARPVRPTPRTRPRPKPRPRVHRHPIAPHASTASGQSSRSDTQTPCRKTPHTPTR